MNTAILRFNYFPRGETTKSEHFQICSIDYGARPTDYSLFDDRVWPDRAAAKQLVDRYPKLLFTDYTKALFPYRNGDRVTDLQVLEVHKLVRRDGGVVYVFYEHPIDHEDFWKVEDVNRKVIIPH